MEQIADKITPDMLGNVEAYTTAMVVDKWVGKREEYLESQGLSSYDIWKDEQAEIEFEENWQD